MQERVQVLCNPLTQQNERLFFFLKMEAKSFMWASDGENEGWQETQWHIRQQRPVGSFVCTRLQ
jgi:hypothetical protein